MCETDRVIPCSQVCYADVTLNVRAKMTRAKPTACVSRRSRRKTQTQITARSSLNTSELVYSYYVSWGSQDVSQEIGVSSLFSKECEVFQYFFSRNVDRYHEQGSTEVRCPPPHPVLATTNSEQTKNLGSNVTM